MAWLIGLDEAGYGPNLGPFAMSAALLRLPAPSCPWRLLANQVRRLGEPDDGRLVVDDSKGIHTPKLGLQPLERAVLPFLPAAPSLAELWPRLVLTPWEAYQAEPYAADRPLPCGADLAKLLPPIRAQLLAGLEAAGLTLHLASVVLFPTEFNRVVTEGDSKAAAPLTAVRRLIQHALDRAELGAEEPVEIVVDRLGGRKHYQPFLQDLFPEQFVFTECETNQASEYRVGPHLRVRFLVGGDQASFAVALASMVSKYLRELLMLQFNEFFQRQAPALVPTAGYPVDALRWWQETADLRAELGMADTLLWRCR
ncbi:MAG TPA: hypothetical protein PKD86_07035 [Gemmatales bacterium]|nr:hypothetical protein [Gemmatales bacterium]HMP59090.1 hypothetical protein [Gemmatales bacterium]